MTCVCKFFCREGESCNYLESKRPKSFDDQDSESTSGENGSITKSSSHDSGFRENGTGSSSSGGLCNFRIVSSLSWPTRRPTMQKKVATRRQKAEAHCGHAIDYSSSIFKWLVKRVSKEAACSRGPSNCPPPPNINF